jgi:hypothetical protein
LEASPLESVSLPPCLERPPSCLHIVDKCDVSLQTQQIAYRLS